MFMCMYVHIINKSLMPCLNVLRDYFNVSLNLVTVSTVRILSKFVTQLL